MRAGLAAMHILVVAHNIVRGDGQGRVLYELVRRGSQAGHRFTCLADRFAEDLLGENVALIPIKPGFERPVLFKVLRFARLADRQLKRLDLKPDLSMTVGFTLRTPMDVSLAQFVHAAWMPVLRRYQSELSMAGIYQRLFTAINRRAEAKAYKDSRAIIAASALVRDNLVQFHQIPPKKVHVIHNAVDPDEFQEKTDDLQLQQHALDVRTSPIALFVGDIRTPRKNLDTVLKALVHVDGLKLRVAGDLRGSPFPALAKQLKVDNRVEFLVFRNDIADLCARSDFFVFPSRYEPFGLVVVEAMAAGLPVVTSKTTGASEVIRPEAGFVLDDPNDVTGLSSAMRRLTEDAVLRAQMSFESKQIAKRCNFDQMVESYLALLANLTIKH